MKGGERRERGRVERRSHRLVSVRELVCVLQGIIPCPVSRCCFRVWLLAVLLCFIAMSRQIDRQADTKDAGINCTLRPFVFAPSVFGVEPKNGSNRIQILHGRRMDCRILLRFKTTCGRFNQSESF